MTTSDAPDDAPAEQGRWARLSCGHRVGVGRTARTVECGGVHSTVDLTRTAPTEVVHQLGATGETLGATGETLGVTGETGSSHVDMYACLHIASR